MTNSQDSSEDYKALPAALTDVINSPEDATEYIKRVMELSVEFDAKTVEQAKREAAVMSVVDSKLIA